MLGLTACTPNSGGSGATPSESAPAEARPLVIYVQVEPSSLATRSFVQKGAALHIALRTFNALPALVDDRGTPRPELLESLPQLNTDTWRVFPDGTMETTYTLRAGLTWHDGAPFTSDDFVFASQVYSSPELGIARQSPMPAIQDAIALDSQHLSIRWKQPYPEADTLSTYSVELAPLPRHILGPVFDQLASAGPDALTNHPFWNREYVGLGPYRLQQWEPGSFIEGVRFDGYPLGAPKIPRIQLRFSADQNVVVAALLAGDAHVATESSIGTAAETLAQQWEPTKAGSVFRWPNAWHRTDFQLRPDLATPGAILDLRVRKAIAHAIDKQQIGDAFYAGQGIVADSPVWTGSAWGAALEPSITTYPYDSRAAERLMREAGFSSGSDSFYTGTSGRMSFELASTEALDFPREGAILVDQLRKAGFNVQQRVVPSAQAQDAQLRATFPAMFTSNTDIASALRGLTSSQIPSADNRWQGGNRGGWSASEYDRLLNTFEQTLDRGGRVALLHQAIQIYTEDLPAISLFFSAQPFAYVAELSGPAIAAPESNLAWNIQQWEWRPLSGK